MTVNSLTSKSNYKVAFLKKQLHFVASVKKQVLIGFILCAYLSFIVIVLQPFDTSQYQADNKTLLLSGFGIFLFFVYVIHSRLEKIWYLKFGKIWTIKNEISAVLLFLFFVGTTLYIYNRLVINGVACAWETYWRFLSVTVVCMVPVFVPVMLYLRQKFGELQLPLTENCFILNGENKKEQLQLGKEQLLFVKAVENYIEICYIDTNNKVVSKTFRQTLSNVYQQVPFLVKCHRSYLVNTSVIKEILGNSQSAKITFLVGEKEIPLSKTYYRDIKNSLL